MRKISGLPEKAWIHVGGMGLEVKKQKVMVGNGLLFWIAYMVNIGVYSDVVTEFIQQGFKFEAVREECIRDTRNPKKFGAVIWKMDWWKIDNFKLCRKFSASPGGIKTAKKMEQFLEKCGNWDELKEILVKYGSISNSMKRKTMTEIKKQCTFC